jgi:predicted transcriptional regulator
MGAQPPLDKAEFDLLRFAARVRAARAVLGWSQTELAKRAAVTQRAIYRIEKGVVRPREKTESSILKAFSDAGLRFELQLNGGFKMIVPRRVVVAKPYAGSVPRKY